MTQDQEPDNEFAPFFDQSREQRQEFRLTGRVWVDVEVAAEDPETGQPACFLRCSSSDISASGLRVRSHAELPEGALLPVTIHLDPAHSCSLIAEVMWSRPELRGDQAGSDAEYLTGFRVYESDDASVLAWKEAMAALLSDA